MPQASSLIFASCPDHCNSPMLSSTSSALRRLKVQQLIARGHIITDANPVLRTEERIRRLTTQLPLPSSTLAPTLSTCCTVDSRRHIAFRRQTNFSRDAQIILAHRCFSATINAKEDEESVTFHTLEDIKRSEDAIRDYISNRLSSNERSEVYSEYTNDVTRVLHSYENMSEEAAKDVLMTRERATSEYAEMANSFLQSIETACAKEPSLSPTSAAMYASVMRSYICIDDPAKAEEVMSRLLSISTDGKSTLRPSKDMYDALVDGWSISKQRDIKVKRAERVVNAMEELCRVGHKDLCPDTKTYNHFLYACSGLNNKWPAEKAEAILETMLKRYRDGRKECRPDNASFENVIKAWGRSRGKQTGEMAEKWLLRMDEIRKEPGFEHLRPNKNIYRQVIRAHNNGNKNNAARRGEAILKHMMALCENGFEDCRPDVQCFNLVISTWGKSKDKNAPQHSQRIIHEMVNLKSVKGYEDLEPNVETYNALMRALAKSSMPDKASQTYKVFCYMQDMATNGNAELSPNSRSHLLVLIACASSRSESLGKSKKSEIFRITHSIFDIIRKSPELRLTSRDYVPPICTIAIATNTDQGRELMKGIFHVICKDGTLDFYALNSFCARAPKPLLRELLPASVSDLSKVALSDLPSDWSRNVRDSGRRG